jgi:hypothetical protein
MALVMAFVPVGNWAAYHVDDWYRGYDPLVSWATHHVPSGYVFNGSEFDPLVNAFICGDVELVRRIRAGEPTPELSPSERATYIQVHGRDVCLTPPGVTTAAGAEQAWLNDSERNMWWREWWHDNFAAP